MPCHSAGEAFGSLSPPWRRGSGKHAKAGRPSCARVPGMKEHRPSSAPPHHDQGPQLQFSPVHLGFGPGLRTRTFEEFHLPLPSSPIHKRLRPALPLISALSLGILSFFFTGPDLRNRSSCCPLQRFSLHRPSSYLRNIGSNCPPPTDRFPRRPDHFPTHASRCGNKHALSGPLKLDYRSIHFIFSPYH